MAGSLLQQDTMFGGSWFSAKKDKTYLMCHVTTKDHVTEESCDFKRKNSSVYVTTLPNLVVIAWSYNTKQE